MLQRQKDLEEEMVALGVKRFREENRNAKKGKHESTTPAGVQFLRKGVAKVEKSVNELKKNYSDGTPYKYPTDALHPPLGKRGRHIAPSPLYVA